VREANLFAAIPLTALLALLAQGCGPKSSPPAAAAGQPPAKLERASSESELARVTLTEEACKRLGVRTEPIARRNVERTRSFGGEVMAPPGRAVTVSAPLAGALSRPADSGGLEAGQTVKGGEAVFLLAPVLTADGSIQLGTSRIQAASDVERAKIERDAARLALDRAEKLLADKAGQQRLVDEGRARLLDAEAALRAGEGRRELLERAERADGASPAEAIPIAAPFAGVISGLHAAAGQTVAAGTPLYEVVSLERLWVRVPVYAGDVASVDLLKAARIEPLGGVDRNEVSAQPVPVAPPSADPSAASVDLFYLVEITDPALRPGERVAALLTLRGEEESLVAPWKAILHDVHGGTWVYEEAAPRSYIRRRTAVRRRDGDLAVLESGPPPGTLVVTDGAAEIFGFEFGSGK